MPAVTSVISLYQAGITSCRSSRYRRFTPTTVTITPFPGMVWTVSISRSGKRGAIILTNCRRLSSLRKVAKWKSSGRVCHRLACCCRSVQLTSMVSLKPGSGIMATMTVILLSQLKWMVFRKLEALISQVVKLVTVLYLIFPPPR